MPQEFLSLNLEGIDQSPNPAIELFPQYIGIAIPQPPLKILLTEARQKKLLLNNPSLPAEVTLDRNGRYFAEYNTYFARETGDPDSDLYVDIHESFHALTHQLNPEISQVYDTLDIKEWVDTMDVAAFSNFLMMTYVDEGISRYGTFEIMRFIKPADFRNPSDRAESHLDQIFGIHTSPDQRPIDALKALPKQIMEAFSTHALFKDYYTQQEFIKQWQNYMGNRYFVGHFFVNEVMEQLQSQDLSVGDALTKIITSPPASLDEFLDIQGYCNRLLNG